MVDLRRFGLGHADQCVLGVLRGRGAEGQGTRALRFERLAKR
jgi:hypothetical protein